MVLDRAMREEEVVVRRPMGAAAGVGGRGEWDREEEDDDGARWENGEGGGELQRRGLLGPRVKGVLVLACKVLEKGEKFGL